MRFTLCKHIVVLFENLYFYYTLIPRTYQERNPGYWVLFEN